MAGILAGASNVTICGGTFSIHQEHLNVGVRTSAFDKLSQAAAHSALHDAPARTNETRCHQHTRVVILSLLERWAKGVWNKDAPIFWLHGGAGAGKSTVMQTLAERLTAQRLALGSFFFSRTDSSRNATHALIPTLVYQLSQRFPVSMEALGPIIDQDPLIFRKSLQTQLVILFIRALRHLVQVGAILDVPTSPRVFLIDGLDECGDAIQQRAIIHAVASVCYEHCIPVKFIIASCPEHEISTAFDSYKQEGHIMSVVSLSEDSHAGNDIRRYLSNEFREICAQHPFKKAIPAEWPHHNDVTKLVEKSSSHFIYASTAIQYIWAAKESPVRSLQVLLGLEVSRTISPFSELDALYHHILGSAAHLDKVLQIIAHCIGSINRWASMACLILNWSRDDLPIFVADMAALMTLSKPMLESGDQQMMLLHASFVDFLHDKSRSQSLHIDVNAYRASILERCIQLLDLYSRDQHCLPDWPPSRRPQRFLTTQILMIIHQTGHLAATQDIVRRHGLGDFNQCQLRIRRQNIGHLVDLPIFLHATRSMTKTPDGAKLFKHVVEDFLDILESYIKLESTPLARTILPLIFLGYPPDLVGKIIFYNCHNKSYYQFLGWKEVDDYPSPQKVWPFNIGKLVDPTSLRQSINTSPMCLAEAAEAILGFLLDQNILEYLSANSAHKSWLQARKPWKFVATGKPRLSSALYARFLRLLRLMGHPNYVRMRLKSPEIQNSRLHSLFMVLRHKDCLSVQKLYSREATLSLVATLLDALLQLLPKAGFSEKIVLYSKGTFPRNIYLCQRGLVRRAHKSLDKYASRVQDARLSEFEKKIDGGDITALIAKSRMLFLDAQD